MKKIILLIALTLLSFTKETNKEEMGYNLRYIQSISECGVWKHNEWSQYDGKFRVIESFLNGQDYLYIDILTPQGVVKVFSIDELDCYNCEIGITTDISCKNLGNNRISLNFCTDSAYLGDDNITVLLDADKEKYSYDSRGLIYRINSYYVVNVDKNDTLNVRAKPSNRSKIIARLSFDAKDIKVFNYGEEESLKWIKIEVNHKVGWVYWKYIEENDR